MKMIAKIKLLKEDAKIPTQGTSKSAGYDLYACIEEDVLIDPGTCRKIGTGVAITPPEGYFGAVFPRSGLATKQGLRNSNCVGVCDEDYTGEYIVALYNDSQTVKAVKPGDRIAQLVFLPYVKTSFEVVDELDKTERGAGGFGSTGTN